MKVSYAPLWKLLIDRKMSQADFRRAVQLSPNTLTKMKRDDEVSLSTLLRIATYFNCNIGDICDFVTERGLEHEL
ncbi:helix-turn-helix transcriptional regulator [Agathobaculum sp. NSJ-28]|uniref:Helix-turn-helix transcriptional regulator n=1 Tax=Agathobaculum faecis TaxID=2763013 RepID=A0A923LW20_9FIRM|nr:helix-turn-helix transcriptional regulator [Agathobaculum faecis]MBC5726431.1 helix-turn-helix transcriptional regulator [Agathobaculum faecis]